MEFYGAICAVFVMWGLFGISFCVYMVIANGVPSLTEGGLLVLHSLANLSYMWIGIGLLRYRTWAPKAVLTLSACHVVYGGYSFSYGWSYYQPPTARVLIVVYSLFALLWLLFYRYLRSPHIAALFVRDDSQGGQVTEMPMTARPRDVVVRK